AKIRRAGDRRGHAVDSFQELFLVTKKILLGAVIALCSLIYACDMATPTEVSDAVPFAGLQFSSGGSGTELPIPSTNSAGGGFTRNGWLSLLQAGRIEPGKWALVRVVGSVGVGTNPELIECDSTYTP